MISLISYAFRALELIILIDCILSWIPSPNINGIRDMLGVITGPILEPFRQLQYKIFGDTPIDLSPVFAIIALSLIQNILFRIILF